MKKTCVICKNNKPIDDFYKSKTNLNGHRNRCKTCHYIPSDDPYKHTCMSLLHWNNILKRNKIDVPYKNTEISTFAWDDESVYL